MTFGVHLHVIIRDTSAEAWAPADERIRYVDNATIAEAQKVFFRRDSEGQPDERAPWRPARQPGGGAQFAGLWPSGSRKTLRWASITAVPEISVQVHQLVEVLSRPLSWRLRPDARRIAEFVDLGKGI
jgi:alkanesulfonate monooxygenase SsuD/methylene tetrahydromethanopterin reductase-like flavin-dependent oxidoreductase (luciferase family)